MLHVLIDSVALRRLVLAWSHHHLLILHHIWLLIIALHHLVVLLVRLLLLRHTTHHHAWVGALTCHKRRGVVHGRVRSVLKHGLGLGIAHRSRDKLHLDHLDLVIMCLLLWIDPIILILLLLLAWAGETIHFMLALILDPFVHAVAHLHLHQIELIHGELGLLLAHLNAFELHLDLFRQEKFATVAHEELAKLIAVDDHTDGHQRVEVTLETAIDNNITANVVVIVV